jgi:hypothetical protein
MSAYKQISFLSYGEDNASHYALYNYAEKNGSYSYFDKSSGLLSNLVTYPQGLHINMAVNSEIIDNKNGDIDDPDLVHNYVIQVNAFLALLSGIIVASLLMIAGQLFKLKSVVLSVIILSAPLFYLLVFGTNFYLYLYGFHTQITAYSLLFLLYLAIAEKSRMSHKKLLTVSLLTIAIFNTWYFVAPVALALLFIRLWSEKNVLAKRPLTYFIGLFLMFFSALPLYADMIESGYPGVINAKGGVWQMPIYILTFIVGAFLLSLTVRKIVKNFSSKYLIFLMGASLIFSLLVSLYQLLSIGSLEYYSFKSLFILPIVAMILISLVVIGLVECLGANKLFFKRASFVAAMLCSIIFWIGLTKIFYFGQLSQYLNRSITGYTNDTITAAAINSQQDDIITYKTCDLPFYGYINNRWTGALLLTDNNDRWALYNDALLKTETINKLTDYTNKHPATVFYNPACVDRSDITTLHNNENICPKPLDL